MKNESDHILIIISSALLLGVIGVVSAYFIFVTDNYDIPWKHNILPTPPEEIVAISQIDFRSSLDDPTGDIIFVETKDGDVYSNVLFEKQWLLVENTPTSTNFHTSNCAPTWDGAQSDSPIWDPPPIGNNVRDSAGIRFEHALAIDVRCYVLLDDGTLEVWARDDNAGSAGVFTFVFFAPVFGTIGLLAGIIIGILIIRYRKKKADIQNNTNNSLESITDPQADRKEL